MDREEGHLRCRRAGDVLAQGVGCGLMGAGIAQVAAQVGYDTIIYEHVALTNYRESNVEVRAC